MDVLFGMEPDGNSSMDSDAEISVRLRVFHLHARSVGLWMEQHALPHRHTCIVGNIAHHLARLPPFVHLQDSIAPRERHFAPRGPQLDYRERKSATSETVALDPMCCGGVWFVQRVLVTAVCVHSRHLLQHRVVHKGAPTNMVCRIGIPLHQSVYSVVFVCQSFHIRTHQFHLPQGNVHVFLLIRN